MNEIVKKTRDCLLSVTEGTEYSVYDVEFVKEGQNRFLRVYIDKEGGVGINDCEFISRRLEALLDEKDYISQSYILEVSSPGIYRKLTKEEDFIRYCGHIVDIKLYKSVNGQKKYRGALKSFKDNIITITLPDGLEAEFTSEDVASVRLAAV